MNIQFAILKIISGDFESGFIIALDVETIKNGQILYQQKDFYARLPSYPSNDDPNQRLDRLYEQWVGEITTARTGQALRHRGIKITSKQAIATQYESQEQEQHRRNFKKAMRQWLANDHPEWQELEKQILSCLCQNDLEAHVLIQLSQSLYQQSPHTADILSKLPWGEWPLLQSDKFPPSQKIYVGINTYQYGLHLQALKGRQFKKSLTAQLSHYFFPAIRILHVLGDHRGINLQPDQAILAGLAQTQDKLRFLKGLWGKQTSKVQVITLQQPSYAILSQVLRSARGFDLFVYSGHSEASYDEELAAMLFAEKEGVTIQDLQLSFQRAIANGLKVAIFNSCASSQLAEVLLDYGIQTVVSMKEEVPDVVAHRFLGSFFDHYAQAGRSIFQSVRESLTDLEEYDRAYPGVGWLPTIHQNPSLPPPLWQELRQKPKSLRRTGLFALFITFLSLGMRFLGFSQGLDLKLFDWLVRTLPPSTSVDQRVVVVTIDQNDLDILRQNGLQSAVGNDVISDGALAAVLEKIHTYEPRWIGLDIVRDLPVSSPGNARLLKILANSDRLLVSCGFPNQQGETLLPPPGTKADYLAFINIPIDPDQVIRRQLLYTDAYQDSVCPTTQSLAFSLALAYLGEMDIIPQPSAVLKLGDRPFPPLSQASGVYRPDEVAGYQILFRGQPRGVIPEISLSTLYADRDRRLDFKDKVILIGYGHKDKHQTVYDEAIPGVVIHAQMVKQILDRVLVGQPLLWVLPWWGEVGWIVFWGGVGVVGGAMVIILDGSRRQYQLILLGALGSVISIAWLGLWFWGLWLPLSSPLLILGLMLGDTMINKHPNHG